MQYFLILAIIIKARTLSSTIFLYLSKVYLELGSCRPISPSSHAFISVFIFFD